MNKTSKGKKLIVSVINVIGLCVVAAVFILPFLWMVLTSVKTFAETMTYPPVFLPGKINLKNFANAWGSGPFLRYFLNSCIVTFAVIAMQFLITIPAAYAYARCRFRGKNIMFGLTLSTLMIPTQLIFVPMFLVFSKMNLINTYWSLILPFCASAFGIFMIRQRFMQIPEEIIEAARLDDASELKILTHIMVPMARPTITTMLLLTFISRWNDYFWPMVMTTKDNVRTLAVGVTMLRETEAAASWNTLMAGNVILVLPILIIFIFTQKHIIQAFTYNGEK